MAWLRLGVAFDFDGVLYETYRAALLALREVEASRALPPYTLVAVEDAAEVLGAWDRRPVYDALGVGARLHEYIWASRVAFGDGSLAAPVRLRGMGFRVYLVCGADATIAEKLRRVELVGARLVFDDILVYEPGGLGETLSSLVEREALDLLAYLDDKPGNTCIAASLDRVVPVLVKSGAPYPHGFAWRSPHCARVVAERETDSMVEAVLDALERAFREG